jgi:hypothetical protein
MKNKRTTSSSSVFSLQSLTRSTSVDHFSCRCTSYKQSMHVSASNLISMDWHPSFFKSIYFVQAFLKSSNLRSVSSVKSGTGASEQSMSGQLLNADSMALQSTLNDTLININTEIDLYRSMINKTSREAAIIALEEDFECYSYELQRQFLWELCLDVSVLFKRYGWGKAFVHPLSGGFEDFGSGERVLFPEANSTHCVIALPKAGAQAFDVWQKKTIQWGIEDEFHFEKLCGTSSRRNDKTFFGEYLCRDLVSCEINGNFSIFKREDCDLFLKQEEHLDRSTSVDQISSPYTSYKPSLNLSTSVDQSSNLSTSVDQSSTPRSVSSVKSGAGASEQSTSGELFNAGPIRLQPSTFHLININTQIDYFRSMMNKTSQAAEILNEKAPEYRSYELHRQFLWELCLDVCPLFERHGWGKAFVCPLNGGYKGFASGGRVLFPEAKSTHRVIAFPRSGVQVFDVRSKQRIAWGREDNFHFENLCAYTEDTDLSIAELSPRDILVCQINQQAYLLKREDCDLFLLQEDCNLLLKPSEEERELLLHQEIRSLLKKRRKEYLQEEQEMWKRWGTKEEDMPSDGWWEHIPEDDYTRDRLTGLYDTPPIQSQVVVCKDHPSVEAWMTEKGVFGVVLSVQPESVITLRDKNGVPVLGKHGKEVRIPGIPRVEVAFSEDEPSGAFYLPVDCVKLREDAEDYEDEDYEEAEYAEDADLEEED